MHDMRRTRCGGWRKDLSGECLKDRRLLVLLDDCIHIMHTLLIATLQFRIENDCGNERQIYGISLTPKKCSHPNVCLEYMPKAAKVDAFETPV